MSGWELGIIALLYVKAAWGYWEHEDPGMALAFAAYAVANIGFIWKG